jgi:hypothetical protein
MKRLYFCFVCFVSNWGLGWQYKAHKKGAGTSGGDAGADMTGARPVSVVGAPVASSSASGATTSSPKGVRTRSMRQASSAGGCVAASSSSGMTTYFS